MTASTALMDREMPFLISEYRVDHKLTKTEFGEWHNSFVPLTIHPLDLILVISSGGSFTAAHDGPREKEHWSQAHYIAVDLEKHADAAIESVLAHPFFAAYGFCTYTTISHTDANPRSRAVFLLTEPIKDPDVWHRAAMAVVSFFPAADPSSSDLSRGFFGNPNARMVVTGKFLETSTALVLADAMVRASRQQDNPHARPEKHTQYNYSHSRQLQIWLDAVARCGEGSRNNTLNRSAYLIGKHIVRAGEITLAEAERMLQASAWQSGLSPDEYETVIARSLRKGISG